jgi:nanoRNase/pAp phosphatase (c-di-AMP/oligoRNAs hydrolase)
MVDRLVLGSGPLVSTVTASLADQSGTVRVVTENEKRAESLRERGIAVFTLDPTSSAALERFDDTDIVAALDGAGERNLAAARTARRVHPDAYLLAYTGVDGTADEAEFADVADDIIDPGRVTAGFVMQRAGDSGRQMRQLWGILRDLGSLAIVTHDNPDPDAIASGVALARLAEAAGCEAAVCYFGNISHQENRAFVNVLNLELRNLEDAAEIDDFEGLALVDHSRPGVNDQLPEDAAVDIVIDHHPPRTPVDARFVDLRSDVGATSTLLVDYLEHFGLDTEDTVATALLFGIHVDTKGFSREVSQRDFHAAASLTPKAELGTLERIESPSISPSTLETVAAAIRNRRTEGEILLSCVGQLTDRDALAQAADRLLTLENVTTTVVYGFSDGTIYVSSRARGTEIDLGETLRDAFDQIGSAGGHVDMAGAQIRMGVLEDIEEREASLERIVESVVADRFLEAVDTYITEAPEGVYRPETADEYLDADTGVEHGGPSDEREELEGVGPGRALYGDRDGSHPVDDSVNTDDTGCGSVDVGTGGDSDDGNADGSDDEHAGDSAGGDADSERAGDSEGG